MKLKSLLAAAALAGSAGLSVAALPDPISLLPAGPSLFVGTFTQPVDGLFIDTFSFLPESFNGLVSVSLSSLSGPVSFFTASLNGQDFSYLPELGDPVFSFQAQVTADMPLSLTVFGAVLDGDGNPAGAGAYMGTISAVVPEPGTWALLLAGGLGVVFASRHRARTA